MISSAEESGAISPGKVSKLYLEKSIDVYY